MFDQLVESTVHHEDSSRKGWFFLGTFTFYFIAALIGLVLAINAYDRSLALPQADLKLIAEVAVEPPAPKPPEEKPDEPRPQPKAQTEVQVPTVTEFATTRAEAAEVGKKTAAANVPPDVAGARLGKENIIPEGGGNPFGTGTGPPTSTAPPPIVDAEPPPPPPQPTPVPKPRAPISGGVLNGKAISLPKPPYPPIAKAAKASGTVTVQVTIDESGKVISAKAVSGHPLLQQAAVQAAYGARFTPTQLSGQPVKVTGVITYNFVAQ
ncbi:MAG TPA: TonB family protein [Pyrinomonadaceae bacterium]